MPPGRTGPQQLCAAVKSVWLCPYSETPPKPPYPSRTMPTPQVSRFGGEAVSWRMTCRANADKRKKRGDLGQARPRPSDTHTHTSQVIYTTTDPGTLALE